MSNKRHQLYWLICSQNRDFDFKLVYFFLGHPVVLCAIMYIYYISETLPFTFVVSDLFGEGNPRIASIPNFNPFLSDSSPLTLVFCFILEISDDGATNGSLIEGVDSDLSNRMADTSRTGTDRYNKLPQFNCMLWQEQQWISSQTIERGKQKHLPMLSPRQMFIFIQVHKSLSIKSLSTETYE